uniref:[histone H3]-lysine(4) N-trimethyltransferase n=1 Tax=Mola mola TaxID=94237 RepID=A0A3Q3W8J6_MOLML
MTVMNMVGAELFDAGKKGRGLRAAKELNTGEVVFDRYKVCHSCFRHQAKLHRCAQCKFAHYCDRTCHTACWDEHKQECRAIKKLGKVPSDRVQ